MNLEDILAGLTNCDSRTADSKSKTTDKIIVCEPFEYIKKTIEASIPHSVAHVFDPHNDGQHLEAVVVSSSFENLLLVKQHQMVMKPLKQAFAESLHALKLKTFTPAQWEESRKQYHI